MKPQQLLPTSSARNVIGHPVAYYPSIAEVLDTKCAVFLSQFIYWQGKQANPEGWIYKTSHEITEETGLTYAEQVTVRRRLKALGLLEERLWGLPAQLHFGFNWPVLDSLLVNYHEQTSENPHSSIRESPELESETIPNLNRETPPLSMPLPTELDCSNRSSIISETMTESTTENTAEILGVAADAADAVPKATPTDNVSITNPALEIQRTVSLLTIQPTEQKPEGGRMQAEVPDEIRLVHSFLLHFPPKDLWPAIVLEVRGKSKEHVRATYEAWRKRGYSPKNFGWLDWLKDGIPSVTFNGHVYHPQDGVVTGRKSATDIAKEMLSEYEKGECNGD